MCSGRLADRGLHDELRGSAYVVIDGVDGRAHHIRFGSLEATGDAQVGAIVEARPFTGTDERPRLSLATRSDLSLEAQVSSDGATWLDRNLVAREPPSMAQGGFGAEVREALERRTEHLAGEGLARLAGQRMVFAGDLLDTLQRRERDQAATKITAETGLPRQAAAEGEHVAGVYRQRVQLASGRFAMIDNGLGFELVPWKPALEEHLGRQVSGVVLPGGGVDWCFGRKREVWDRLIPLRLVGADPRAYNRPFNEGIAGEKGAACPFSSRCHESPRSCGCQGERPCSIT